MIPRLFNAFPVDVKKVETDKDFIRKVEELMLAYQFYNLDNFFVIDFFL